jgi:hypothetical protein
VQADRHGTSITCHPTLKVLEEAMAVPMSTPGIGAKEAS